MVYGSNVLPSDASYYQLTKASILDGVLSIDAGGSAKCTLNRTQLNFLTEYFRVNLAPINYTDSYVPQVYVHIDVETAGEWYNYTLFPVHSANGVFTTEIHFDASDYIQFTFEIVANEAISFALWEICPESAGDVETIIDGVKQSLPRLLYDYNTTEITVAQSEQIVAMINCYLIGNTDLQGHFLMNFTSYDRCTVHLRFFDSSMIELFSPIVHTVNNGYNTIEVPHAYLNKLIGSHSFYVTAQVTNGYLTVPIRGILYTIDGGYLAERLLNPGMDISDVSLMQLSSDREPSEIWAIGVDNNQVIVKKRTYDLGKVNATWDVVYVLGEGTTGAIEFDGNWVRREGSIAHTLETHSLPAIAYVDTSSILWLYQHGMTIEPIEIASGVTCVSMVRGYKSNEFVDKDQGLVLCWVQNGNVYYKQYAYFNGSYQWHPTEQLVDTGDVTFVQVHRLNDYRVGIVIQTASENIWYISDRTYVSQAVPTEITETSLTGFDKFIVMSKEEQDAISFAATANTFGSIEEAQSDFSITFTYEYLHHIELLKHTLEQWKSLVSVTVDSKAVSTDAYDLFIEGNTVRIHLHEPTWGTVKVSWNTIGFLFFLDSTRCFINTQASYSYTWNVWKSKSHAQPVETVKASITGSVDFQYIEVVRPVSRQPETIGTDVSGTLSFEYLEVNKVRSTQVESLDTVLEGVATFTMVLIGDQPI